MCKIIIIEGTDRVGKSSVITGICEHYQYDNVFVRHCGKPPKNVHLDNVYKWQMNAFIKEGELANYIQGLEKNEYQYYENVLIYNRYYLGEYVYGVMFREYPKDFISSRIKFFEETYVDARNTFLITLVADPEFILRNEDGNSFSKNLEQKTTEIELFKEIHEKSIIKNKLAVKVDKDGKFLPKEQILNTILNFIK